MEVGKGKSEKGKRKKGKRKEFDRSAEVVGWVFRLVSVAAGAAAGKLLDYEEGSAGVGVQTAYGIEVEVRIHHMPPWVSLHTR